MNTPAHDLGLIAAADYGGFWIRVLATLLDSMILFLPLGWVLDRVFGVHAFLTPIADSNQTDLTLQVVISGLVYIAFWLSAWQGTPGKRICGLVIVDSTGRSLSLGRALARYVCSLLASLTVIGVLLVALTPRKQGLHDLLAGTFVIKRSALARLWMSE
jgi:uncharacterized RDD family membrane protein YckC